MKKQVLPVDVLEWLHANKPEDLFYEQLVRKQICFVHDTLCNLMSTGETSHSLMVISTHLESDVVLPVYQLGLENYGVEIVLGSDLFDHWTVSLHADQPLKLDCMGLFNPAVQVLPSSCKGFPPSKIYGAFANCPGQFTFALESNYELYTFVFLLKNYLGV